MDTNISLRSDEEKKQAIDDLEKFMPQIKFIGSYHESLKEHLVQRSIFHERCRKVIDEVFESTVHEDTKEMNKMRRKWLDYHGEIVTAISYKAAQALEEFSANHKK